MRILYVGPLDTTATATHRRLAMERLGHEVVGFDVGPYVDAGGSLRRRLRIRTLLGPTVERLNRDVIALADRSRPDVIWFDKAVFVRPQTIKALRAAGHFTVHYNPDNPFGLRRDPGWRLFLKALPEYDLHLVPREKNVPEYHRAGARDVKLMPFSYEPTVHFPSPAGWSDAARLYDVVFIGAPYDGRAQFITDLWRHHGIPVRVWGDPRAWRRTLPADAYGALFQGGLLWNKDYRETIWRSRICLSFVTHANVDQVAHKSFEIAACGAFLLAEDTPGHRALVADGKEAVLFNSVDDCARKIGRYLPDESARRQIAKAGRERIVSVQSSNDERIDEVLRYVNANRRR